MFQRSQPLNWNVEEKPEKKQNFFKLEVFLWMLNKDALFGSIKTGVKRAQKMTVKNKKTIKYFDKNYDIA